MKLRRIPEDFRVRELAEFPVGRAGQFAVYTLEKSGLGTLEAVSAIQHRWRVDRQQMSWGGLKDRHASTSQYLTIERGPRRDLQQANLKLTYLGLANRPFTPAEIQANEFSLVLRSLSDEALARAVDALADVNRSGLPNYFDDQRFGSVSAAGEFIARPWIAGNYERTLWLAIAEPHPLDRPDDKAEKQALRELWGQWEACGSKLTSPVRRSVVGHLERRPTDFRGAWAKINVDLRGLYLAAFQSHLWNQLAGALFKQECPAEFLFDVPLKCGPLPFFQNLPASVWSGLQNVSLPLPTARAHLEPGPITDLVTRSLAEQGLEMREIRVKYPRDSFFSKGWRAAVVVPAGLTWTSTADELAPGRRRLDLQFTMPRGSYATILVKRITQATGEALEAEGDAELDDI